MGILEDLLKEDAEATGAETSTENTEEKTEKSSEVEATADNTEPKGEVEPTTTSEENTEEHTADSTKEEIKEAPKGSEYWKSFGDFESEDAFKAKWEEFNSKPAQTKYATSLSEEFDNFVRNGGPEDFNTFKMIRDFSISENPTAEDMIDAIVAKRVMDDPDYRGMENQLANKIKKEYGLDISEDDIEFMEEDEKSDLKFKEVELKKEFRKAAKSFEELKSKSAAFKDEELEKRIKEGPSVVQGKLDKELSNGLEVPYPVVKKNEKGELVVDGDNKKILTFTPSMVKEYRDRYSELSQAVGYTNMSDGSQDEQIIAMAKALAIGSHLPQILSETYAAAVAEAQSKIVESEMSDDNPSSVGTHVKTGDESENMDRSGDIFG